MKKPSANNSLVKIGAAAKILGVSIDTLRRWEKSGKLSSIKTPNGTRFYSPKVLKKINPLVDFPTPELQNQDHQPTNLTQKDSDLAGIDLLHSNYQLEKNTNQSEAISSFTSKHWQTRQLQLGAKVTEIQQSQINSAKNKDEPQWTDTAASSPNLGKSGKFYHKIYAVGLISCLALILIITGSLTIYSLIKPNKSLPFSPLTSRLTSFLSPQLASQGQALELNQPLTGQVLAQETVARFLEINSDTKVLGKLDVESEINGLTITSDTSGITLADPASGRKFSVTGTDVILTQSLTSAASPTFSTLSLFSTSNQLVLGAVGGVGGTLTWTPTGTSKTLTLPDITDTLVTKTSTDTLTNKTISGSSNTISNISSSALSGSYTGITGVGTIGTGTWNGTKIGIGYGGTNLTTYTTGDILYASATDTLAKLTAGSSGQILTLSSGIPAWTTAIGAGQITADSLDFTELADSMTLDANLTISASASNYSVNIDSGTLYVDTANNRVGIGTTSPANALEVLSTTTPQLRVAYDTSAFFTQAVAGTTGAVTFDTNGTTPSFTFSDGVTANTFASSGVTITGGSITGTTIGASNPSTGAFTTLTSSGNTTLGTGASSINTIGSTTTPGTLTLHGATTLDNTFTVSGSNLTSLGGNLTVTGTAWTATPTISGAVTMTSGFDSNAASTVTALTIDGAAGAGDLTINSGETSFTSPATTANANAMVANSLTSGDALDISSSATAFTGNLIDITLSGSNAANTGSLLSLTNSGTLNTNTTFYLKHYAIGTNNLAFRIDDESGDTTPFVINGGGQVGIGTTSPGEALDVVGDGKFSGTLAINGASQDDSRGINISFNDETGTLFGLYNTYNQGDDTTAFTGLRNDITHDAGGWVLSYGVYNQLNVTSAGDIAGVWNEMTNSGTDANVFGIYNSITADAASAYGLFTKALTTNDASVETVYAIDNALATHANDVAYGLNIRNWSTTSSGGTQYGVRINLDDTDATRYSLYIDSTSGISYFGSNVGIGTTAPDAALEINHATGDSLRLTYNDADGSATNYTDFGLSSTGALTLTGSAATLADSATAEKTFLTLTPGIITLTGPTQVTSVMDTAIITGATIAASGATTVNDATGLSLTAPVDSTNTTLTRSEALRINDITSGAGTLTSLIGLYLAPMTGGATNNIGICFDCDGTWSSSTVASGIQFGSDANSVNLYRSASDTLKTDDAFTAGGLITASAGVTLATDQNLTLASGTGTYAQTFTGTTTDAMTITASSLSTGTALTLTGPTSTGVTDHFVKISSDIGSASSLVNLNPDFSGSAVTGYGIYNLATDATSAANTDYGYYGSLALTGNAAKTGVGVYSTITSSSTTADTLTAFDAATSTTGIITTGTRSVYGMRTQPSSAAASTGGTTNVYGVYSKAGGVVGAGGTINSYGLYVANGTMDGTGTSSNIGLYMETPSGADTNYAAIFAGGSVGIGVTDPDTSLDVIDGIDIQGGAVYFSTTDNTSKAMWAWDGASYFYGYNWTQTRDFLRSYDSSGDLVFQPTAGNVGIGTTAPDAALEINHATGDSLRLTYNDADGSATNYTDFSLSSTGALTLTGSAATLADSASAEKTFFTLTPGTITLTGTTTVTSVMDTSIITGATIAASGATTVNDAAGLSLTAPVDSTNTTLTRSEALRINDVTSGAGTLTSLIGLYIAPMTGGATNNIGLCFDCDGTWSSSTVASGIQFGTDANLVNLYRSASDTLKTDDSFSIATNLVLPASTATTGIFYSSSDIYIHMYGSNNFFAGRLAGNLTLTGNGNTGIGYDALKASTTGNFNTAIGAEAGQAITTGQKNVALGRMALYTNTTGSTNMAIGQESLYYNTTGGSNVGLGDRALYRNTEATFNMGIGESALSQTTTGGSNAAVGRLAGASNTTGTQNVAIGVNALGNDGNVANTASYNVAIGADSLKVNTSGTKNTAVGRMAMIANTTASENVAIGEAALNATTTGGQNVAIGGSAGQANTTGTRLTFIGYQAGKTSTDALTNAGAIGYNAQVTASNALVLGGTGSDAVSVGIGTTAPDAALEINHATGDSLRLTYNDSNGSATNYTDFSLSSTGALTLTGSAATLADSASAEKTFFTLTPGTITLTGTTTVTSVMDTSIITGATIAASGATTVNDAAGLSVSAPIDSTNTTLTRSEALRINDVTSGAGTLTSLIGLYIAPMTGGATNNIGLCFDCDGTWSSSTVASGIQFGTDANLVNLYRSASDTLKTDDAFTAGGLITGSAGLTITGTTNINATGTSATNIGNSTGALTLASGGTSAWTNTSGNLTISTATSGTLALTSAGALNLSAAAASTWALPASTVNALNIGSNLLSFDTANSRVGIGTSTPGATLDVAGAMSTISNSTGDLTITPAANFLISSGSVGIGDATPSYKLEINTDTADYIAQFFNDGNNANRSGIQIQAGADDASGTTYYLNALDGDGGQVGYIANTAGTFALTDPSDIRLKTNVSDTRFTGLDIINNLRVVDFNRLSSPDGPRITSFIAQEVQEIFPQMVSVGPDGYLGVSKETLIPILVKSIQEQSQQISSLASLTPPITPTLDDLKAEIASLSARITHLEGEPADVLGLNSILEATPSANYLSNLGDLSNLSVLDATISGTLKSLGNTFLGNTIIAGSLSVDGTMSITENSINVIGDPLCHPALDAGSMQMDSGSEAGMTRGCGTLYLQNSPLAQAVDFFNGKVTITKEGTVSVQKLEVSSKTAGTAKIPANSLSIQVNTPAITSKSKVLVTAQSELDAPLFVTSKIPGSGFKVNIKYSQNIDTWFDWWIVEVRSDLYDQ